MNIFRKLFNKNEDSSYCEMCTSCGVEGCCSPVNCAYNNMVKHKNKKCMYGETYFKDLQFAYLMYGEAYDLISKTENAELFNKYNKIYDKIWDDVYGKDKN